MAKFLHQAKTWSGWRSFIFGSDESVYAILELSLQYLYFIIRILAFQTKTQGMLEL
jgi:hypothetical protein